MNQATELEYCRLFDHYANRWGYNNDAQVTLMTLNITKIETIVILK